MQMVEARYKTLSRIICQLFVTIEPSFSLSVVLLSLYLWLMSVCSCQLETIVWCRDAQQTLNQWSISSNSWEIYIWLNGADIKSLKCWMWRHWNTDIAFWCFWLLSTEFLKYGHLFSVIYLCVCVFTERQYLVNNSMINVIFPVFTLNNIMH